MLGDLTGPESYEVAWDYYLEQGMIMPSTPSTYIYFNKITVPIRYARSGGYDLIHVISPTSNKTMTGGSSVIIHNMYYNSLSRSGGGGDIVSRSRANYNGWAI